MIPRRELGTLWITMVFCFLRAVCVTHTEAEKGRVGRMRTTYRFATRRDKQDTAIPGMIQNLGKVRTSLSVYLDFRVPVGRA